MPVGAEPVIAKWRFAVDIARIGLLRLLLLEAYSSCGTS
jgi:hypothetical protein